MPLGGRAAVIGRAALNWPCFHCKILEAHLCGDHAYSFCNEEFTVCLLHMKNRGGCKERKSDVSWLAMRLSGPTLAYTHEAMGWIPITTGNKAKTTKACGVGEHLALILSEREVLRNLRKGVIWSDRIYWAPPTAEMGVNLMYQNPGS